MKSDALLCLGAQVCGRRRVLVRPPQGCRSGAAGKMLEVLQAPPADMKYAALRRSRLGGAGGSRPKPYPIPCGRKKLEHQYHFSCQFTADLIAMNSSDFIITSTYQEIAGDADTVGACASYCRIHGIPCRRAGTPACRANNRSQRTPQTIMWRGLAADTCLLCAQASTRATLHSPCPACTALSGHAHPRAPRTELLVLLPRAVPNDTVDASAIIGAEASALRLAARGTC